MIALILQLQVLPIMDTVIAADDPSSNTTENANVQSRLKTTTQQVFVPGDAVLIDMFPDTTSFLNNVFAIDDDGNVDFPIIGKTKISDMSVTQLKDYIRNQFKMYLRSAEFKITPLIRVSMLGGFTTPGQYYVNPDNSLWQAIDLAGGATFETGFREMRWERNRDEVIDDLIPFIQEGISLKKMGFKSGDQIWTPTAVPLDFGQTLNLYLPFFTFATSIIFFYLTYQQQLYLSQLTLLRR